MFVESTPALLMGESEQVKIPSYDNRVQILLSEINHLPKKDRFKSILSSSIDSNQTPLEIIRFIPDVKFYVKLPTRRIQYFHG
jgi:hypothetical protein